MNNRLRERKHHTIQQQLHQTTTLNSSYSGNFHPPTSSFPILSNNSGILKKHTTAANQCSNQIPHHEVGKNNLTTDVFNFWISFTNGLNVAS